MESEIRYIEAAVTLPVYQTFTYSVPGPVSASVSIGKRILVPFGKRRVTAYVFGHDRNLDNKQIKPILDVLDEQPLFPSTMVPFFKWIADYYKYPVGQVVENALPGGLNVRDYAQVSISPKGLEALETETLDPAVRDLLNRLRIESVPAKTLHNKAGRAHLAGVLSGLEKSGLISRDWQLADSRTKAKRERFVGLVDSAPSAANLSEARKKVIAAITAEGEISVKRLKQVVPTAGALITPLERAGYLTSVYRRVYRDPFGESIEPDRPLMLNREQRTAVSHICSALTDGYKSYLLRGVTGSGKTEVYLQIAAEVLKAGRRVLVLVPEIALITQMERRFRARFGDCVTVLHSGLSSGERYDQWTRIMQGMATVAIGARSAIFAPFSGIGVIIVDEEHDTSYKQEGSLRYNARDLATVRAKQNACVVVLGSATPSVQSYHNVVIGKFAEQTLTQRIEQRPLPDIHIVDLRRNRELRGNRRFISPELHLAMKTSLERGEQVLLFLNRRGYASFPVCGACGQPMRCKNCDISLTLHQDAHAYRCHYCGFSLSAGSKCSLCGSAGIRHLGLGTEKLEAMVASIFPKATIARMDQDTTQRKGSIVKLLKGLKSGTTDILIGTQMVAKGHDFPNITLVGIICADLSLAFPDFRAGERTFQLLAQVAGRAGRGERRGSVILQTYNPDHFSITAAKQQDFMSFYHQEIEFRKALNYPPYSRMVQLKISGPDPAEAEKHARLLGELCRGLKSGEPAFYQNVEIMGPIEASLTRIAGRYRWQILLKGLKIKPLHHFVDQLLSRNPAFFNRRPVQVAIDVDPLFMM